MTTSKIQLPLIDYPESDGQPMTESDATRDYLLYCVAAMESHFQGRRNVYVSGNLFIYYREGDPKCVISPDVFVIFGVSKRKRRSYKTWQEGGKLPSFILEVTSFSTKKQDEVEKPALYASLGVQEYFQYDPTGDYLSPRLKGQQLVNGSYQAFPLQTENNFSYIHSPTLGLDLCLQLPQLQPLTLLSQPAPLELHLRDPQTGTFLLNYHESEQARAQAEAGRLAAEQAQAQAEQAQQAEATARRSAIPRLRSLGLSSEQIAEALSLPLEEVQSVHQ
jgi:Uma2 family endonuclease